MQDCYFLLDNVLDAPHGGLMVKKNSNANTIVENMLGHYDDFSYNNFYNVNKVSLLPKDTKKFVLCFLHMPTENTPQITASTIKLINEDPNVFLVVISVYEYVIADTHLHKALTKLGIKTEKVIALTSNIEAHGQQLNGVRYYTINFWESYSRFHLKLLPSTGFVDEQTRLDTITTATKKFICLNRNVKPHRIWFYYSIIKNDMLNQGHVSYHLPRIDPKIYRFIADSEFVKDQIPAGLHKDYAVTNARKMTLRKLDNLNDKVVINFNSTTRSFYTDSLVSYVTESESDKNFLTEKTYKTIMNMHPFFIVGNPDQHTLLRQRGYETFEDLFGVPSITDYNSASGSLLHLKQIDMSILKKTIRKKYFDKLLHNQQHLLTRKISWNTIVQQLLTHTIRT
jgi:hypothetical protein